MSKELTRVDNSSIKEQFENHLSEDANNRIILSGPFGVGKTTFLTEFLSPSKYNNFWISPVKYSVGTNEDVFEFIKFDLIREICFTHFKAEQKIKIPENLFIWSYLNNNTSRILNSFFELVAHLSPETSTAQTAISGFRKIYNSYNEFKKDLIESDESENKVFSDFIGTKLTKVGSIFEDDIVTQSIRSYLDYLKEDGKENVLIIDDFDRIDPDHVFRILNILSVHNDYLHNTYNNKFGFDKIILICDIDSIENYFYHKYGSTSNFNGYIDKFCSTQYFRFSNQSALRHFCQENLSFDNIPKSSENTLIVIINTLIDKGKLTLRNILKFRYKIERNVLVVSKNLKFNLDNHCEHCSYIDAAELCIDTTNFPFFHCISILSNIFGDFDNLKYCFSELAKDESLENMSRETAKDALESVAPIAHLAKNHNTINSLCYQIDTAKNNEMHFGHGTHIKNPIGSFMNNRVELNFAWTKYNKYKGDTCFFDDVQLNTSSLNNFKDKSALFQELVTIMDFLKSQGYEYTI